MKIDIDDAMMKKLVSEAILTSLTDEKRGALIQGAIEYLVAPGDRRDAYGSGRQPSPIEAAFQRAISNVANDIAKEMLADDMIVRLTIRNLITKAVEKLANDNDDISTKIRDAIVSGLSGERR